MKRGKLFLGVKAIWPVVYSPKVTGKQTFGQILPLSGQLPAGPPWGAHTSDKNTAELFLKVRGKNKYSIINIHHFV